MSYETLDTIADSYIPVLLVLFVAGLAFKIYQSRANFRAAITHIGFLSGLLVMSYGLMFFDNAVHLWPALGLDYSTHTAVALSLVFALCVSFPSQWKVFVISILLYALLMLYQRYHSILDIISTSVVIGFFSFLLLNVVVKKRKPELLPNNVP
ncbi:MAG TPA: hypothetical protein VIM59_17260 [Cellvibrio sp.]